MCEEVEQKQEMLWMEIGDDKEWSEKRLWERTGCRK
jgi:hypothetical protein